MTSKIDPTVCHPEYKELNRRYEICDDAFEGEVCKYVPRLPDQTNSEYNDYVSRSAYFNIVDKTVTAVCGALTRKPYQLTGYTSFPATEDGNGTTFIQECYRDLLLGARVATLVEIEDNKSKLINFDADDIINWYGSGTVPGDFVMIKECQLIPDPDNRYAQIYSDSWRELYIGDDGYYAVRVWTESNKGQYVYMDMPDYLVNGKPIDFIPLWVTTPYDNSWDIYSPPLMSQASLNLQHFRQSTDLAHYAHFMALPTFTITGDLYQYTDDQGNQTTSSIKIGSTKSALHLTQGSTASYTEVSGASFAMLQSEMANTEERMYIVGSRLLSTKNGVESASALQLRSGSETASMDTLAHSLESTLNSALALCSVIDNVPNATISLNKDFLPMEMDPAVIKAKLELFTAGTITLDQLLNEMYKGEVVQPII